MGAGKHIVLIGTETNAGASFAWHMAVCEGGRVLMRLDASTHEEVLQREATAPVVVRFGMLTQAEVPERVSALLDEAVELEALAAILLPGVPESTMPALCAALDVAPEPTDDPVLCVTRLYEALCMVAESMAIVQLRAILRLLPAGTALCGLFEQWVYAREMATPPGEDISALADVIVMDPPPVMPEREQDPEAWQPLPESLAEDLLGAGGMFAGALETYETRTGQLEMTRAVIAAFNAQRHLLCEAGTGTGKSLAYLVPAIHWAVQNRTPVVVSTNTKNLQAQLYEKDIPLVQRVTGLSFRTALIKGRSNYLCIRKLQQLLRHPDFVLRPGQHALAASVVAWLGETTTGDLAEVSGLESRDARGFTGELTASAEECSGRGCRFFRQCFVRRARARSMAADVVVANHALVLAEMAEGTQAIPAHAHLVLDEAHNLEDAATRCFTVEISRGRLRYFLRRLGRLRLKRRGSGLLATFSLAVQRHETPAGVQALPVRLQRMIEQMEQAAEPFFLALGRLCPADRGARRMRPEHCDTPAWQDVMETETRLRKAVAGLVDTLHLLVEMLEDPALELAPGVRAFTIDFAAMRAGLAGFRDDLADLMGLDTPNRVFWVERDVRIADEGRLLAAPVAVGESLCSELYAQHASIVFTSATMTVRGQFDFLMSRLGLDRVLPEKLTMLDVGTPFDYRQQAALMVPMFLPDPASNGAPSYSQALSALLAKMFLRTRGRGLALFTSYAMLQHTTSVLRDTLHRQGITVLAQGEAFSREHLTDTFRDDVASVLMGTHSFWEGVDVAGDTLSCVVLARLPFAVFTDPVVEARCEALEAAGISAFRAYSLPQAVIRFRQGFGRLIRHCSDRGVVVVTDRRMISKSYGHWFRGSVPVQPVPFQDEDAFLDAIEQFLAMV